MDEDDIIVIFYDHMTGDPSDVHWVPHRKFYGYTS